MNVERIIDHDRTSLNAFARHARTGFLMTVVGAGIVLACLVYSTRQLATMQTERAALADQVRQAAAELARVNEGRDEAERELAKANAGRGGAEREGEQVQANVKAARASFVFIRHGLRQFYAADYKGAIDFYEKAIAADAGNPVLYDLKGYALLRRGDVAGAIAALERSTAIAPDYAWGHYNLALAYGAAKDMARAIEQIRTVLQLDPGMKATIRDDVQFRIFRSNPDFQALMREA